MTTRPPFQQHLVHGRFFLHAPGATAGIVARLAGPVAPEALRRILPRLIQKHPLIGARVVLDAHGNATFVAQDAPELPLRVTPREDDEHWHRTMVEEMRTPLSLQAGPVVRLTLVHGPATSELIVATHHAMCDGVSDARLAIDAVALLNDPQQPIVPAIPPVIAEPASLPRGAIPPALAILVRLLNAAWLKSRLVQGPANDGDLEELYWRQGIGVRAASLTPEVTAGLVAAARRERVSVTGALGAVLLQAQHEVLGRVPNAERISLAIDVRNRLRPPAGGALGMYSSAFQMRVAHDPRRPPWENARRFQGQLQRSLHDERRIFLPLAVTLVDPRLQDALVRVALGQSLGRPLDGLLRLCGAPEQRACWDLSNLGAIDAWVYDVNRCGPCRIVTFFPMYSTGPLNDKVCGVVTCGGVINLLFSHRETSLDRAGMDAIVKRVLHLLRAVQA